MNRRGILSRAHLREALLALLVVALTFLNFGHLAVTTAGEVRVTSDSWCGDPLRPDAPAHAPCHACRIGAGADLPPPPAGLEPVTFVALPVAYVAPVAVLALPVRISPLQPRGPPALV